MISLSSYGFNAALHGLVLAAACWLTALAIRKARFRAMAILIFMGALLVAPWLAMQPAGEAGTSRQPLSPANPGRVVKLPRWTVATLPPEPEEAGISPVTVRQPVTATTTTLPVAAPVRSFQWPPVAKIAAAAWLAGGIAGALLLILNAIRMAVWRRRLPQPSPDEWLRIHPNLSVPLGREAFRICGSSRGPCVAGLLRPVIVIPAFLLEEESQELAWALRHEVCHLRAGDSRWIWALCLVRTLYWWNPFVHALAAQWGTAREKVCDLAAAGAGDRPAYGRFLIEIAARKPERQPLSAAIVRSSRMRHLRTRIVSLLEARPNEMHEGRRGFAWLTLTGLAAGIVAMSGLTIAEDRPPSPSVTGKANSGDDPFTVHPRTAEPGEKLRQTMTRLAVVYSKEPLENGRTLVLAHDYDAFCRRVCDEPSTIVAKLPSITAQDGEKCLVEIISEVILPNEKKDGYVTRNLGWKIDVTNFFAGESIHSDTAVEFGYIAGKFVPSTSPKPPKAAPEDYTALTWVDARAQSELEQGDLSLLPLGKIDDGSYATLVTEVHQIDDNGANDKIPRFRTQAPCDVLLRGIILTLDLSEKQKRVVSDWHQQLEGHPGVIRPEEAPGEAGSGYTAIDGGYYFMDDPVTGIPLTSLPLPRIMNVDPKDPGMQRTGRQEELEHVVIRSEAEARPWKSLDLSLGARVMPQFLESWPTVALALRGHDRTFSWPIDVPFAPRYWVVELPAEKEGTRRLMYLTAETNP